MGVFANSSRLPLIPLQKKGQQLEFTAEMLILLDSNPDRLFWVATVISTKLMTIKNCTFLV